MENQNIPPLPPQMDTPIRPKNWLVESILVTILCCLPFGIVGIINASKVNSLYDQGLYDESIRSSANAKKMDNDWFNYRSCLFDFCNCNGFNGSVYRYEYAWSFKP